MGSADFVQFHFYKVFIQLIIWSWAFSQRSPSLNKMSANGQWKFRRISRAKREKLHRYSVSLIPSGNRSSKEHWNFSIIIIINFLNCALAFCDRLAGSSAYMTTRMSRLPQFAIFYLAAGHLLFSICPVSSRIYRTKDAVVIEGSAIFLILFIIDFFFSSLQNV